QYLARAALVLPVPAGRAPGTPGGLLGPAAEADRPVTLVAVAPDEAPGLSAVSGWGSVAAVLVPCAATRDNRDPAVQSGHKDSTILRNVPFEMPRLPTNRRLHDRAGPGGSDHSRTRQGKTPCFRASRNSSPAGTCSIWRSPSSSAVHS